jgi:hypothetical protein
MFKLTSGHMKGFDAAQHVLMGKRLKPWRLRA